MARPRAQKDETATHERVLVAAAQAFGERGYEAATLEEIGAQVGIRRASLLYHFQSKQALYTAVVRRAFLELEGTIERAVLREGDFEARMKNLIEALIDFEREHLPLLAVLLRGIVGQDKLAAKLVEDGFVPLVDRMEGFVRLAGGAAIAPGFPVRAALLQVIFGHLVRSAMGSAGVTLWRGEGHTWALTRALFVFGGRADPNEAARTDVVTPQARTSAIPTTAPVGPLAAAIPHDPQAAPEPS